MLRAGVDSIERCLKARADGCEGETLETRCSQGPLCRDIHDTAHDPLLAEAHICATCSPCALLVANYATAKPPETLISCGRSLAALRYRAA